MSESLEQKLQREGIKIASASKRIWALSIDELILSFLFMLIFWDSLSAVFSAGSDLSYEEVVGYISKFSLEVLILRFFYQTFFVWYYGATLGKMAMKIVCIDTVYLDKPSFGASLVRALGRNLSESLFYLGFLWAFSSPLLQTWHDKFSKVVVVDVA